MGDKYFYTNIIFSPGYYGYLLSAALYGLCLGCLLYTSKLYCYNSVKAKEFGHVWSMVAASQAVSALGGIMVTGRSLLFTYITKTASSKSTPVPTISEIARETNFMFSHRTYLDI